MYGNCSAGKYQIQDAPSSLVLPASDEAPPMLPRRSCPRLWDGRTVSAHESLVLSRSVILSFFMDRSAKVDISGHSWALLPNKGEDDLLLLPLMGAILEWEGMEDSPVVSMVMNLQPAPRRLRDTPVTASGSLDCRVGWQNRWTWDRGWDEKRPWSLRNCFDGASRCGEGKREDRPSRLPIRVGLEGSPRKVTAGRQRIGVREYPT